MKSLTGMARNLMCAFHEKDETFIPMAEIILQITEPAPFGGERKEETVRFVADQQAIGELAKYFASIVVDMSKAFGKKEDK